MFTGDLCGVPSQFFRHISSAFVDLLGYFTQAFLAYIPASISIRSDNVIRLMFPCFPQDVTETIIALIAEVNVTL